MKATLLLLAAPALASAASCGFEDAPLGATLRAGALPGWQQTGLAAADGVAVRAPGFASAQALWLERHEAHARWQPGAPLWRSAAGPAEVRLALRLTGRLSAANVIACRDDTAGAIVTLLPDAVLTGDGGDGVYRGATRRWPGGLAAGTWYRLRLALPGAAAGAATALVHLAEAEHPERILLDWVEIRLAGRSPLTRIDYIEIRRFGGAPERDRLELDDLAIAPPGADVP